MREPMSDEKTAYEAIIHKEMGFGKFHKTCFHVHTPASYDYHLFSDWTIERYKQASEQEIYDICTERGVFPRIIDINSIKLDPAYRDKKEMLSYVLLADAIIASDI